jgi:hypothetical protein
LYQLILIDPIGHQAPIFHKQYTYISPAEVTGGLFKEKNQSPQFTASLLHPNLSYIE